MNILDLVVKWIHVSSACLVVGLVAALLWGVLPGLDRSPEGDRAALAAVMVPPMRKALHICLGLLLLTGAYNFWRVLQNPAVSNSMPYQAVIGIKILLYLVVFGLAIVVFRAGLNVGGALVRIRPLLLGSLVLLLLIVLASAYLNIERIGIISQSAALIVH